MIGLATPDGLVDQLEGLPPTRALLGLPLAVARVVLDLLLGEIRMNRIGTHDQRQHRHGFLLEVDLGPVEGL